jgi:flagellar biosynthetic protein FliP
LAAPQQQIPDINISLGEGTEATDISLPLQIVLLLTILTLVPSILVMLTSFTRIIIVFHFLRQAMGTQSMPPNQIMVGMALFLTFMIMWPVGAQIWEQAIVPYNQGEMDAWQALSRAELAIRGFMQNFIREKDLALFLEINNLQASSFEEVPTYVVVPAFMLSEVKTAFEIGFLLYLPFLIIDMVVASVLLSMGMIMLPPILISLPFKLLVFIMVDGWYLVIGSLVRSFLTVT